MKTLAENFNHEWPAESKKDHRWAVCEKCKSRKIIETLYYDSSGFECYNCHYRWSDSYLG